jgi:hypothetical protein
VVLDELHVLERYALAIRQGHSVAGLDVAVGGEGEDLPGAARREDHRAAQDEPHRTVANVEGRDASHRAAVDHELRDELLVVADDAIEAHRMLEQRVEHVEADLVGGVPGALGAHAAEGPRGDAAVLVAAPGAAPVLEQRELLRSLLDEVLDDVLVAQEVGALHRVEAMHLQVVVCTGDCGGPALGGDRVAPHRVDLRHHRDGGFGVCLDGGDCGAQACGTAADDDDVVPDDFEQSVPRACGRRAARAVVTNPARYRKQSRAPCSEIASRNLPEP